MKRALRILGLTGGALLAIPLLYLLGALILGAIPANAHWHEARQGIRIFVRTNGVHTWIMVPKVTAEMDWRPLVPGKDLKDPRWGNGNYVALGYGNKQFYLNTPRWADLSVRNAFWALAALICLVPLTARLVADNSARGKRRRSLSASGKPARSQE